MEVPFEASHELFHHLPPTFGGHGVVDDTNGESSRPGSLRTLDGGIGPQIPREIGGSGSFRLRDISRLRRPEVLATALTSASGRKTRQPWRPQSK